MDYSELLSEDICLCICQFLSDQNALQFLSCNTTMHSLSDRILFTDEYSYDKIKDLPRFNNFAKIKTNSKIPSKLSSSIETLIIDNGSTSDFVDASFPNRWILINAEFLAKLCRELSRQSRCMTWIKWMMSIFHHTSRTYTSNVSYQTNYANSLRVLHI